MLGIFNNGCIFEFTTANVLCVKKQPQFFILHSQSKDFEFPD